MNLKIKLAQQINKNKNKYFINILNSVSIYYENMAIFRYENDVFKR